MQVLLVQVLEPGEPPQRAWFGYSDDDAFAVGLTCGGVIDVLVTPVTAGSPAQAVLGLSGLLSFGNSWIAQRALLFGPLLLAWLL